jgi:hypothetical protein
MRKVKKREKNYLTEADMKSENEAKKLGIGYQTLMQLKLREAISNPLEKRIEALERKIKRA